MVQTGNSDALEDLIKKNTGLIWCIVKRFYGRGYDLEDLYQIGSIGFIKAIKFKELPKIDELISQLNLILDKFNFIYSACKNWTITIDKKKKH